MATAPDPVPTQRMKDLLTCSICKETLEEPRTLHCSHSFCKRCLSRNIEIQREKAQKERRAQHLFNCPTCRTQFELRQDESVERLPPNYFINNMLDILPVIQQQEQKVSCESCKAQLPATCRCIECERYLCKNCLTTHNNWLDFKKHVVMTLEELAKPENQGKAKGKPRCKKHGHGNKPLEFYCNTCHELACVTCVLLDHPKLDHDYQPIDVVAGQHKEALKTTSAILQQKSNESQTALQKIEHATQNLQTNTKKAKDVILRQEKEILQVLTQKVKRNTAVLLGQVDEKHDEVNQKLVKQHDDIKAYVEKANGSLEFAKNIIEKGSNEEILSLGKEIEVNANDIEKKCPKTMLPAHNGNFEYLQSKATKSIADNIDLNDLGKIVDHVVQSLCERSTILEGDIDLAQQLAEWMEDGFCWQLCYRASDDGWEGKDFHRKCDDVGPTLTLVKCGTNFFGGYTDQSRESASGKPEYKRSNSSFLFSLQNKDNLRPFKCPIRDDGNDKAIWCYPGYGAIFGSVDLCISDNANTNQYSYSDLGGTYQPPPGYQYGTPQTQALLAGSCHFQPSEIEVFRR